MWIPITDTAMFSYLITVKPRFTASISFPQTLGFTAVFLICKVVKLTDRGLQATLLVTGGGLASSPDTMPANTLGNISSL